MKTGSSTLVGKWFVRGVEPAAAWLLPAAEEEEEEKTPRLCLMAMISPLRSASTGLPAVGRPKNHQERQVNWGDRCHR